MRPQEISSRKPQARRETPRREQAGNEGRRERVSYGVRSAQRRIGLNIQGRGEEVARSATENDAAAGGL